MYSGTGGVVHFTSGLSISLLPVVALGVSAPQGRFIKPTVIPVHSDQRALFWRHAVSAHLLEGALGRYSRARAVLFLCTIGAWYGHVLHMV